VKRIFVVLALVVFSLAMFLPFSLNLQAAKAQSTSYSIGQVDHKVEVLYSGHVVIHDTIQVSGTLPDNFLMGFPYKYSSYMLKSLAYDSNNKVLPMTLGVQLQETGYYGASIHLPAGSSQTFTVVFILANDLLSMALPGFHLDFPAYPSFTTTVAQCNVNLSLPLGASSVTINKEDGALNGTTYTKQNLEELAYYPATATFSMLPGYLQLADIPTLNRQISVNPSGEVTCIDTYRLINNSTSSVGFFEINLPLSATNIVTKDELGRTLPTDFQTSSLARTANVTLLRETKTGEFAQLTLDYTLPSISRNLGRFVMDLDLFPYFSYLVDSATVTLIPPEGAKITTPNLSTIEPLEELTRNVFQDKLSITKEDVSYLDSTVPTKDVIQVAYDYSPLWIALLPTTWMWAITIVGSIIAAVWLRPRVKKQQIIATSKMTVDLSPERLKTFTDSHEEKNKIIAEIRSLEARAQRGRIPRTRYKAQRRTLELRLNTLNQNISEIKVIMRNAGGSYAESVRQLEFAEVELNEVELELKTVETLHATGEIPIDAYRKQLTDLERRKTKAETAINGVLLRLRGEIR
jgi:hypothetical protein